MFMIFLSYFYLGICFLIPKFSNILEHLEAGNKIKKEDFKISLTTSRPFQEIWRKILNVIWVFDVGTSLTNGKSFISEQMQVR